MKISVLAGAIALASTATASAHDWYGGTRDVDGRRAWEARRIENGLRSGRLTWPEYWFLRREQAHIAADERRAKDDGYVSRSERYHLNRELDKASRDIYRLNHNDRVAWWRRYW